MKCYHLLSPQTRAEEPTRMGPGGTSEREQEADVTNPARLRT